MDFYKGTIDGVLLVVESAKGSSKDLENHFLKGHMEYMPMCPLGNFGSNSSQAPRKPLQKKTCQCRPLCPFHWPFENFGLPKFLIGT
jgi:hypothetical protein